MPYTLSFAPPINYLEASKDYHRPVNNSIAALPSKVNADFERLLEILNENFRPTENLLEVIKDFQVSINDAAKNPKTFARVILAASVFCSFFRDKSKLAEELQYQQIDFALDKNPKKLIPLLEHIRDEVLSTAAEACLRTWGIEQTAPFQYLDDGLNSWAVRTGDKVVLISKGMPSVGFEKYKLRRWCAKQFEKGGIDHQGIKNIACRPVLHVLTDYVEGISLSTILRSARKGWGTMDLKLGSSLTALGEFIGKVYNECTSGRIKLEGYGKLLSHGNGGFRGSSPTISKALSDYTLRTRTINDKLKKTILKFEQFGEKEFYLLPEIIKQVNKTREPAFIANYDPLLKNYLYSSETKKIYALDLDEAHICMPSECFARLIFAWGIDWRNEEGVDFGFCIDRVLEAFEPDTEKLDLLRESIFRFTAIMHLNFSIDLIDDRSFDDISPEDKLVIASHLKKAKSLISTLAN
ncbi:MAG: hypothetical protein KDD56_06555 [Bdellovibrionales bacterium]|nr:hypothetical protein [Bdellovibrionales bacterium]